MRQAGMSLTLISFTSLLYWPWALKFLWAPYLDYLGTPRRWLLSLQFAGVGSALVLGRIDARPNPPPDRKTDQHMLIGAPRHPLRDLFRLTRRSLRGCARDFDVGFGGTNGNGHCKPDNRLR